ncbi:MAG TPA: cobalt-precorrin 5A hydrolase [Geobacteraceae bacterium]|nr:cobalt-precorrin 5A hydrolase [Geobacteraceae bacterium]
MRIAIIAITRNGARLGTRLKEGFAGAELFVLKKYSGQAGKGAVPFTGELHELIRDLWQENEGFIFIMAAGIVVRVIAPLLSDKERDPAVVVMDDAGRFAVSLLSGHLGGANELARKCAFLIGSREVITTATDANSLPSFDMLAAEEGWVIDDISRVKTLNALLLDNEDIAVVDPTDRVRPYFHGEGKLFFCETFMEAFKSEAAGYLFVTNRHLPPQAQSKNLLVLRPKNLVLGIGCNSGTSCAEIEEVISVNMRRIFLSIKSVRCIATASAKREEAGLLTFAAQWGIPLEFFESVQLNEVPAPSPPSTHALEAIGAAGVAEPAAILASGCGSLLLKKIRSGNVTLAIAETG